MESLVARGRMELHVAEDEDESEPKEGTKNWIMDQLVKLEIEFDTSAKKGELQALLDESVSDK